MLGRAGSFAVGVGAVAILAAGSTVAAAGVSGGFHQTPLRQATQEACAAPALRGTVVDVRLIDMGGMMNGGPMGGAPRSGQPHERMRILVAPASVPAGTVSFRVHNVGAQVHELVIMPLAADRQAGQRLVGSNARVAETGSLGEASRTCGANAGRGIAAGATGWATLTLPPGSLELVCNVASHYSEGMYASLVVQ